MAARPHPGSRKAPTKSRPGGCRSPTLCEKAPSIDRRFSGLRSACRRSGLGERRGRCVAGAGVVSVFGMGVEGSSELLQWAELVAVVVQVVVTGLAAFATLLSVAVIAWQSVMTRQSVVLTREALEVARREAEVAAEGLSLARLEADRSAVAYEDERRAQVDAVTPALSVHVDETVRWGERRSPLVSFGAHEPGTDVNGKPVLVLDEHNGSEMERAVAAHVGGSIANDSGARAEYTINAADGRELRRARIEGGNSGRFKVPLVSPARVWVRRYRAPLEGGEPELVGSVRFVSHGDRGVAIVWPIYMVGSVLVPERDGSDYWIGGSLDKPWRATARAWSPSDAMERHYFYSLSERGTVLALIEERFGKAGAPEIVSEFRDDD